MPEEGPAFEPFKPILDRILIRLVRENGPNDGFQVPERFRQQTNKGEVLAVGDVVVLSMQKFPITDFINVGDHILFGQYTAEEFTSEEMFQQFKLTPEDQIYIIRVQDVRGTARLVKPAMFGGGSAKEEKSELVKAAEDCSEAAQKLAEYLTGCDPINPEIWPGAKDV